MKMNTKTFEKGITIFCLVASGLLIMHFTGCFKTEVPPKVATAQTELELRAKRCDISYSETLNLVCDWRDNGAPVNIDLIRSIVKNSIDTAINRFVIQERSGVDGATLKLNSRFGDTWRVIGADNALLMQPGNKTFSSNQFAKVLRGKPSRSVFILDENGAPVFEFNLDSKKIITH